MDKTINDISEQFGVILDNDETIIKVFKPNKAKLYISGFISAFIISLIFSVCVSFPFVFLETETELIFQPMYFFLTGGILLLGILIWWLFVHLYYKKVFFAYSNKRIIVRTGIIGVDFKCLDMSMIGAVNVNVSFVDKIVNKNTGTITFGSMANPMNNANGNFYRFSNIQNPYEVYKEIKTVIASHNTNIK